MSDGQLALNTNLVSPGLFFKDSNGDSVKIGPIHVGATAPNATPGAGGQAGNSKGEAWLDTTATNPILKVWNGSAFVAVQPVGTGTVVSTTDTGTVTSTMILDGTILNADVNASAAIAGTKISPDFGSQTIATTGNLQSASINGGPLAGMRNAVMNGSFAIAQRGTSFTSTSSANNDDTYNLDRWYVLSDGNDAVDITQNTSVIPTNGKYAIALDVETINKKFGIAQIIEADNCIGLIGETVTLSFKAKVSATTKLDNVKAAIVAWSGTADTVTSDIISAWNVEGTNPTLIANATYENTPANLNLTTSYATYSVTAAVDTASTKNILVFIWSDVTDTTLGDFLYITDVQLERGPVTTPFERRPIGTELALCQRYYQITAQTGGGNSPIAFCFQFNTTSSRAAAPLTVTMRTNPPILDLTGTPTLNDSSGTAVTLSSISISSGIVSNNSNTVGLVATTASRTAGPVGAWAGLNLKLAFDAEL